MSDTGFVGPGSSNTPAPYAGPTPNPQPGPPPSGAGQDIVGQQIQSSWWDGSFEITQAWGPTTYSGEPPEDRQGRHYEHWHAGIDVGAPCGTHIKLPAAITQATVSAVDNPGGYGTALTIHLSNYDVWIGHLARRLVTDGATVRGGQDLAISNNTGNSSGCHIHFEVRPKDGKYGSDVDPVLLMSSGQDAAVAPVNPLDALGTAVTQAEASISHTLVAGGQVVLGIGLGLGGILVAALGPLGAKNLATTAIRSAGTAVATNGGSKEVAAAPVKPVASPKPLLRGR